MVILPRMQKHYKRTLGERTKLRKRRLRDTLNDPVLTLQMEDSILLRPDIQGDRHKMLQFMQQIRDHANSPDEDQVDDQDEKRDNTTKGLEKYEAALVLCRGTIVLSVLFYCACTTSSFFSAIHTTSFGWGSDLDDSTLVSTYMYDPLYMYDPKSSIPYYKTYKIYKRQHDDIRMLELDIQNAMYNFCDDGMEFLYTVWFCLIHMAHSYKILYDASAHKKRSKSTSTRQRENTEKNDNVPDLEQPLLAS
eukprot:Sro788_g202470.2  (249) ;mRNA; r:3976-4722